MRHLRLFCLCLCSVVFLAGCQSWAVKQGFEDRDAMRTPEGQERLVEIAQRGGYDGERAVYYLLVDGAPPQVYRPALNQVIRSLGRGCSVDEAIDGYEIRSPNCDQLIEVSVQFGEEAVPALESINDYGATVALEALGMRGAAGTGRAIQALGSAHGEVRLQAVAAIQSIAPATEPVLEALGQLEKGDKDPAVREAAGRARLVVLANRDRVLVEAEPVEEQPAEEPEGPGEQVVEMRPNDIALVIGIESYRGDLPDSQAARRDAQTFANLAESHLGLERRNIIVLVDDAATRSSLEAYFEDWLPRNAREDGRVYVFFAGHGAPDPQTGEGYLVPWDGDPKFIDRQGIAIEDLTEQLKELPAQEVVLMMDSCFSGSGGRSVLAEGTRPLVPVQAIEVSQEGVSEGGFSLFAAAQADEVTGMTEDGSHGLFSYYLFEGLRGAADADGNQRVTKAELSAYLERQVANEARRANRDQTPFSQFLPESVAGSDLVVFEE